MAKAGGSARNFRTGESEIRFVIVGNYESTRYKGKMTDFYARWSIVVSLTKDNIIQIKEESVEILASLASEEFEPVISVEVTRSSDGVSKFKTFFADESFLTRRMLYSSRWAVSGLNKEYLFKSVKASLIESMRDIKKLPQDVSAISRISPLHDSLEMMAREISSLDEYNISPDAARMASDPLPMVRMGNDGSHIAEVIHALEKKQFRRFMSPYFYHDDARSYENRSYDFRLVNAMSKSNPLDQIVDNLKAGVSSIDGISTQIDSSTGKRHVVFRCGEREFRPEEVSDGTIKWLCLLVALYVPRSRVILLEEPENFMHPWMQQRFISLVRDVCKKNGTSVIMSTHSVTVLNALLIDELSLVRQLNGSTDVGRVPKQDELRRLLSEANFGLGDIWVSGGIGGVSGGV
jgi:hypothetical protein